MLLFYKATHNLVYLSLSVVPVVGESARATRASATSFSIFVSKRCRTTTYQKSFSIRTTRIWSLLTGRMDLADATLTITSFKSLYDYYSRAVRINYNLDNPQTFKTICLKCNSTRFLDVPIMCFMERVFYFLLFTYVLFLGPQ